MARKKKHEDHTNHEAWAIPYADLMTLLLAFFVVMYAISSLNEGKYRIMADALNSAFGGTPHSSSLVPLKSPPSSMVPPAPIRQGLPGQGTDLLANTASNLRSSQMSMQAAMLEQTQQQLNVLADDIEQALGDLIRANLIVVRRSELWLEVEINSDILFATGSAVLESEARNILDKVAKVLAGTQNQIRIEGYTDNRPINNAQFPSNWELSAARSASVVHLFSESQIAAERLSMVGFGEFRPLAENSTPEGQGRNRRVILVVLASGGDSPRMPRLWTHKKDPASAPQEAVKPGIAQQGQAKVPLALEYAASGDAVATLEGQ